MTGPTRRLISRLFWPLAAWGCQCVGVASRAVWLWTGGPAGARED